MSKVDVELLVILIRILVIIAFMVGGYLIRRWNLEHWVSKAVKAAEMLFMQPGTGEKKKQWVIDFITGKFKISRELLDKLIEAAVFEINVQKGKYIAK
jgi:hypothetical protein